MKALPYWQQKVGDKASSYVLLTPRCLSGHGGKQRATPGCRSQCDPVELVPAEVGLTDS